MKLHGNFDTSIQQLLDCMNDDTRFISDWNKGADVLNFDLSKLELFSEYHINSNSYFFSDEFHSLKENYAPITMTQGLCKKLEPDRFSVVSNCTIAGYLSTYYVKKKHGKIRAILLAPTYFTYIQVLQDLGAEIFYIHCYNNPNLLHELYKIVANNPINMIIVTEPLFGTGVSLERSILTKIKEMCEEQRIYLLVDYAYGGMLWEDMDGLQDAFFLNFARSKYVMLITSICKRLFINGIKHGIIIANPEIIKTIEHISVYTVGCLSEQQIILYKRLHSVSCYPLLIESVHRNNRHHKANFELMSTTLSNTCFDISSCNCGYFCLVGIPIKRPQSSMVIAKRIMEMTNILTIPHDRYIFDCSTRYYFRVNLAVSQDQLLTLISTLSQTYFDGIN